MAEPNDKLKTARQAIRSGTNPGEPMTRAELALAVNTYLWVASNRRRQYNLTEHTIGRYERGEIRWPSVDYRRGLRRVLNVHSDVELGFWPTRRGNTASLDPPVTTDESAKIQASPPSSMVSTAEGQIGNVVATSPASISNRDPWIGNLAGGDSEDDSPTDPNSRRFLATKVVLADLTTVSHDSDIERRSVRDGEPLLRLAEQSAFGPAAPHQGGGPGRPVTEDDAAAIETTTAMFRAWDNAQGGGLRRKAVVGQLADTVALLDRPFKDDQAARRCYSAIADLAQLAGWMTWDLQLHTTAQNYYLLGLTLARDAGDRSQVSRMMYCLSRQMIDLDRPVDALNLAAAGSYAIRHQSPPKATALLLVAQARAHACLGSERECRASLRAAQDSFAGDAPDREWCDFLNGAEFAGLAGVALRDLALTTPDSAFRIAAEAREWTEKAANNRSDAFLRSKILDTDGIAVTSLLAGEPDRAAIASADALALTSRLRSPRTIRRVTKTIAMGARAFPRAAPWGDLADRARALPGSVRVP